MIKKQDTLAVVWGAGGLGVALAEALVERGEYDRVILISRRPVEVEGASIDFLVADFLDEGAVAGTAQKVENLGVVRLVLIATGLLHDGELQPERALRQLRKSNLERLFAVNTIGPMLVAKHFVPLMPRGERSVLAAISARVGSISDNRLGGWYGYRASKAALNMCIRNLAIELSRTHKAAICVGLHPGTVETKLSQPFLSAVPAGKLFQPHQSAAQLLAVVNKLQPEHTGKVFDYAGKQVPE